MNASGRLRMLGSCEVVETGDHGAARTPTDRRGTTVGEKEEKEICCGLRANPSSSVPVRGRLVHSPID